MKVSREKIIMTSSNKSLYMHLVSVGRTGLVSLTLVRLRGHTRPVSCLDCDHYWLLSDPVRPSDLAVRGFDPSGEGDRMLIDLRLEGGRLLYCLSHQGSVQDMKVGREKTIMTSSNKSLYMHCWQDRAGEPHTGQTERSHQTGL